MPNNRRPKQVLSDEEGNTSEYSHPPSSQHSTLESNPDVPDYLKKSTKSPKPKRTNTIANNSTSKSKRITDRTTMDDLSESFSSNSNSSSSSSSGSDSENVGVHKKNRFDYNERNSIRLANNSSMEPNVTTVKVMS